MADEDGRWMTFAELAATRGTTKRAAVMLVRRHKWPRQQNNQGHVIALVPATWAEPAAVTVDRKDHDDVAGHSAPNGTAHAVVVLEQALQALRDAQSALQNQLEGKDSQIAELRVNLDQARADADQLRQADAVRRARGRWARLRSAWRGD